MSPIPENRNISTGEEKLAWVRAGGDGQQRAKRLMQVLRAPDGCPWDNKQDHSSLAKYLQEESHELMDVLLDPLGLSDQQLIEELGDVYLQVLFHARIAEQENRFSMDDVADALVEKMVERHPHVFADEKANTAESVASNWEQRKQHKENKLFGDSIPSSLPALRRAQLLASRASQLGFDWDAMEDVFGKLGEEIAEFRQALQGKGDGVFHEIGDLLTVVVNLARFAGVDPEEALQAGNQRFIDRFRLVLEQVDGAPARHINPQQWDQAWEEAKRKTARG